MFPIQTFLAGLTVAGSLLHAGETQILTDDYLSRLRTEGAHAHPAAAAGKARAAAAAQDVRSVRLWNDPMVGVGFMAADRAMRKDLGDVVLSVEQALPKRGMFEAQQCRAEAVHRAELENFRSAALAAGAEAARSAIELALADESISLQQTQITWLAEMIENAKQKAADPMGSSMDALRLETELAKDQQMLDATRRDREGYARMLNLLLGHSLDSPWPEMKLPATPPPVPIAITEIVRIPHVNPKVRAMNEMASAAKAEVTMADRERQPEFSVGIGTNLYSGSGDFRNATVGLKMSLPWFNDTSYQAKIAAAKNREIAAKSDVESMHHEIASLVLSSATEAANAAAQARAYSGEVRDKAEQTSRSIEAAWISSKAPLTDMLDSRRMLFSIRLEQRRFIAMQLAALEELQSLVPTR